MLIMLRDSQSSIGVWRQLCGCNHFNYFIDHFILLQLAFIPYASRQVIVWVARGANIDTKVPDRARLF